MNRGELLLLLDGAMSSLEGLTLRCDDWQTSPRPPEIVYDRIPGGPLIGIPSRASSFREARPRQSTASERRLWLRRPDWLRVEIWHEEALVRLGVRRGSQWWRWDRQDGVASGDEREIQGVAPPLLRPLMLEPATLLGSTRLVPQGYSVRAGRRVIVAEGEPRTALLRDIRFHYEFDLATGMMMSRTESRAGELAASTQVTWISFDVPTVIELFEFVPPSA